MTLSHEASAQDQDAGRSVAKSSVADGIDGLPGLYRVPVLAEAAPRVGAGMWMNYGYTEPQNESKGAHHRIGGTVAVGGALFRYVELGLKLDVRHDIHPEDEEGKDSGTVIDWAPVLRVGLPLSDLRVGVEARPVFYGATAGEKIAGPTPEGRLVVSYVRDGWAVSGFGGYRTPFHAHDQLEPERMRSGDRVALGVSEYAAVTTGLGVLKELSPVTLFGEATWDILVGDGAPSAGKSPLRLALGARRQLVPGLFLQATIEVDPAGRAPSLPTDPLVPIEPRVSGILGLTLRWPDVAPRREPEPPPQKVEPKPVPKVEPPPPPPPPAEASLRIEIVDESGHPISDAQVHVRVPASADQEQRALDVPLSELNVYLRSGLTPGKVDISIEADLLQSYEHQVELVPDQEKVVQVKLRKAQGLDGQLRGLVRSYSGEGIAARVTIQPGDQVVQCDAEGVFELELPPGNYAVMIEADGFTGQKRPVRIRKDGVTVLNADLHRSK